MWCVKVRHAGMTRASGQSEEVPRTVTAAAEAVLGSRGEAPRLKRIFDHSHVPMVIVDARRRYVEVNRPARLVFWLSLGELRSLTVDDLTPPHLTGDMKRAWARLLETGCIAGRYPAAGQESRSGEIVYRAFAQVLPGLHLIAFAPADWLDDELDATEDDRPDPTLSLTPREVEVLALAADGRSGPEVAQELVLSTATVNTHFKNIYEKLGVRTRAAAVAKAIRLAVIR